jgi:6-phosphofructokinase 1
VITFGYTAVSTATDAGQAALGGQSHKRVVVVELMGRYAGWIALRRLLGGSD